jgi:hypothetical protein
LITPAISLASANQNTSIHVIINSEGAAVWKILVSIDTDIPDELKTAWMAGFEKERNNLLMDFQKRIQEMVNLAEKETGRSMEVTGFNISTDGKIIEYSFVWKDFAIVRGDRIEVGDVFPGGFYLFEGDSLTITIPDGWEIVNISPSPDSQRGASLTWYGPENFKDGQPSITLEMSTSKIKAVPGFGSILAILALLLIGIKKFK